MESGTETIQIFLRSMVKSGVIDSVTCKVI